MRDRERREKIKALEGIDENDARKALEDNEDELLHEMYALLQFIRQNKEAVEKYTGNFAEKDTHNVEVENPKELKSRVKAGVAIMLQRQQAAENGFSKKLKENVLAQQAISFEQEVDKNEEMRARLIDEYDKQLSDETLSDSDRAALLAELHAKIAAINEMIRVEEDTQNNHLNDALAKRKAKKEKLRNLLTQMAETKENEDMKLNDKLSEIQEREQAEIDNIKRQVAKERKDELENIDTELAITKRSRLAEMEQRIEKHKKSHSGGVDHEYIMGDLLVQYGELSKNVDQEMIELKEQKLKKLEEKMNDRRAQIRQEIADRRKEREAAARDNTVSHSTQR